MFRKVEANQFLKKEFSISELILMVLPQLFWSNFCFYFELCQSKTSQPRECFSQIIRKEVNIASSIIKICHIWNLKRAFYVKIAYFRDQIDRNLNEERHYRDKRSKGYLRYFWNYYSKPKRIIFWSIPFYFLKY